MGLDINTPRGQQTLVDEHKAAALFERHRPHLMYIHSEKEKPGWADAVICEVATRRMLGIVQTSCRYDGFTVDVLAVEHQNEWLLSDHKLMQARQIAIRWRTDLYGFLYMVDEHALMYDRIWSDEKGWCLNIIRRRSRTRRTVNGGSIIRLNAYIDMSRAKVLREPMEAAA